MARSFKNIWPSFVWMLLTDENILDTYDDYAWRFVPMKWRHWWIDSIKENNLLMEHVSLNNPPAIFKDVTMDLREMISDIDDAKISVIIRTCDKHVLPTVLCPWGESEFLHTCGDVQFDSVLH